MGGQSIHFHKMHGLGNDFIVIDARQQAFTLSREHIRDRSDRHTGIGCDQWLIIEAARHPESHASYRIFNADGSTAEQCLNGLRCIAWFLALHDDVAQMQLDSPTQIVQVSVDIERLQQRAQQGQVQVQLPEPALGAQATHWQGAAQAHEVTIQTNAATVQAVAVSMGNPHAVSFVNEPRQARARHGAAISTHPQFSQGVNAGFAHMEADNQMFLAVFERGSGPTHACGSGACAAAVAAVKQGLAHSPVRVRQPGGSVMVDWQGEGHPVLMTGPAVLVFSGEFVDDTNGETTSN